jgi:hypothetical protein
MFRRFSLGALVALLVIFPAAARADTGTKDIPTAKVMTRNLYLGADLSPAIGTTSVPALIAADGAILHQVTATNFPVRAEGLASEILAEKPDYVGLQEVALWRTGPVNFGPLAGGPKTATTVRYDFLQLLLDQLNQRGETYRAVVVEPEFDFEAPADENGDGLPAATFGADLNGRLTMRDVILERADNSSVKFANPQSGQYAHLLSLPIVNTPVPVTRGWTAIDAKAHGSGWFRFVNTHLEAFDPRTLHPSIRAQQTGELIASGGPATGALPVVLVGDLNSDDDTVVPDDQQAYQVLLDGGFSERSTNDPLSCCIESSYDLTTGTAAEFDHQVDHVMTNDPDIGLLESGVTGRTMNNGWWDSDHAGVWSTLLMR